jgi:hypothetical protein
MAIQDITGITSPLYAYVFVNASAETLTGFFVDSAGRQVGLAYDAAEDIGTTPRTLATLLGLTTVPESAVGFRGNLSGDVKYGLCGNVDGSIDEDLLEDITDNSARYPTLAEDFDLRLGRT